MPEGYRRAGVFANTEEGHAARVHELLGWMDANMFVLESETAAALARKDALISWFRHSLLTDPYFMFRPLFRIVISAEGSCNVLCASAEGIEADDIVMIGDFVNYKACTTDEIDRVSKIVVTTMQNVGLSDSFLFNDGENEVEDVFRAILILMHELCKGEASPIHAYLATWPRPDACADMPLYWTDADLNQLAGTLSQFMIQTAVKEVRDISEILKRELGGHLDFAGAGFDSLGALFKYVVCNFQSRAFEGLSLSPVEVFNGTPEGYNTCKMQTNMVQNYTGWRKVSTVLSTRALAEGEEMCLDYGEHGTHALFAKYGFVFGQHEKGVAAGNSFDEAAVWFLPLLRRMTPAQRRACSHMLPSSEAELPLLHCQVALKPEPDQPEAQDAGMLRQLAVISCVEDSEVLGRLAREWRLKANVGNFAVGMAMLRTVADSIMAFATTQEEDLATIARACAPEGAGGSQPSRKQTLCARVRLAERNVLYTWLVRVRDTWGLEEEAVAQLWRDAGLGQQAGAAGQCVVCGWGIKVLKCGQCKGVAYCSRQCQKKHWPKHKLQCQAAARGR
mmetsp:Transcript_54954/g.129609  ORF Transcript_54954/g.129609 Transcript_54954/m.129609 type:complete len:563 (-) Transcript_54954:74-1762(-)